MPARVAIVALTLAVAALPGARHGGMSEVRRTAVAVAAPGRRPQPRLLRGHVERADHTPVADATVRAILAHERRTWSLATARTGPDGAFAFPPLPEGSYQLVASAEGCARGVAIVRAYGDDPAPVTLTLAVGARIAGTVTARAQGEPFPLQGAFVRAWREGGGDDMPWATRCDAQGRFTLDGVAPGSYRVEVAEAGYELVRRVGVPAPTGSLSLAVRALAALEGVVRTAHGDGARGAVVLLAGSGIWPPRTVPVMDDGRFLVEAVPSGVYELRASRDDDVAVPIAPLVLEPGDHREVALSLGAGVTFEAAVVDADTQRPLPGARVILAEDALSVAPRALVADSRGVVRAPGLLARTHQVSVRAPGYAPKTSVLVDPSQGRVVLALDRAATLEGRVVDSRGNPVANTQVELTVRDNDGAVTWLTGATVAFREALFRAQAQGPRPLVPAGELGVMPGRVPLIPVVPVPAGVQAERVAPGFVTGADGTFRIEELPPGVMVVSANHPAYVRAESQGQLIRAGERAEVTVTLHRGGTLDGRVLTERGFPMRAMQVEVRSAQDAAPRRVFTLGDGSFRVPAVRGHVVVVALMGARVAARAELEVGDDATVPVTLTVPGALRRIEGRVTDTRGWPVGGASVSITSLDRGALGSATTITHADGTFDTVVGGARAVNLEVRHPSYAPRGLRVDDPARPLRIELSEGASLETELRSDGCISGEVRVELRTPCGPMRSTAHEGETLRIDRLCGGRITLVVDAPGCVRAEVTVTVGTTGLVRLPRIEFVSGGAAEGDVVDGRGDPVAGAVIARVDAPPEALTGTARSDRRGAFAVTNLPVGDIALVAWHPTLGRSRPEPVRIERGTVARALRLRFEGDLRGATRVVAVRAVALADVAGGGVEVRAVGGASAAERAGLRPGDRVLTVGAEAVRNAADAEARMGGAVGDDVVLEVERDGVRRTVRFAREAAR